MLEENKTKKLKEDELSKVSGGLIGDPRTECVNFNEFIRNSNVKCCDKGKTKAQGAKYNCCSVCGQTAEIMSPCGLKQFYKNHDCTSKIINANCENSPGRPNN